MPVICEWVDSCNKVIYNKKECYLGKDGWLYMSRHPIIAYIILFVGIVTTFNLLYLNFTANFWRYWLCCCPLIVCIAIFLLWKTWEKELNIKLLLQRLNGYLKKINDSPECRKDVIAEIEDKEQNILDNIEFWYIGKDMTIIGNASNNNKYRKWLEDNYHWIMFLLCVIGAIILIITNTAVEETPVEAPPVVVVQP